MFLPEFLDLSKEVLVLRRIILLFGALALVGCSNDSSPDPGSSGRPPGTPGEYFPVSVGSRWQYAVTISQDPDPLQYREVVWPQGERGTLCSVRGRFLASVRDEVRNKPYALVFSVRTIAVQQGPLQYPIGVELAIEQDELGVFDDASHVYWAIANADRTMAHLVTTYPADSPGSPSTGAWGLWGAEDGYSIRLLMFGDRPGIGIGFGREPSDHLFFEGVEQLQGYSEPALHFQRRVDALNNKRTGETGDLASAFTEDTWFVRGIGLVRLTQSIGMYTTMTWALVEFSPGR